MNLDFELYDPKYNNDLVGLFERAFKKKISSDFFLWRFIHNPAKLNLGFIAKVNNTIAGFGSLTPVEGFVNSQKVLFAISGTSMISPDFQKKGIYTKMATYMYDYAYKKSVDFILGFPNYNSHYSRITKLKNFDIYQIPQFSLKKDNFFDCSNKSSFNYDFDLSKEMFSEIDIINRKRMGDYSVLFNSDYNFFKWRYLDHPFNQYKVCAVRDENKIVMVIVYKLYTLNKTNQIDILDIYFYGEKKDFLEAMSHFFKMNFNQNIHQFNLWLSPHCELYNYLELIGFRHGEPITYLTCHKNSKSSLIENYKDWYISMASSDIY